MACFCLAVFLQSLSEIYYARILISKELAPRLVAELLGFFFKAVVIYYLVCWNDDSKSILAWGAGELCYSLIVLAVFLACFGTKSLL